MIIRLQTSSEKGHCKAIKVAAAISGVESVTIAGEDKNLLLVIGVGIDSNRITEKLRRKVGHAEVVELRTVDAADELGGGLVAAAYRYHPSPSPYKHAPAPPRVDYYNGGGGGGYPAQYQQPHDDYYFYHPAAANTHTVVHHEYASDPNGCSVM